MFFLPCPMSFSARTKLYQGLTLAFLKRWELHSAAAQQSVLSSPKILENRNPTWRLFPVPFPFCSVTKQCSEFLPLICLHGRKQEKLRHGHLGYFSSWIPWCITSNVRFFFYHDLGNPCQGVWEILMCWISVGQMVWSVICTIPRWWQILMGGGYQKLLCPVSQGEMQRVVVPRGFDLTVQSEDAPQGQMYWSIWWAKKHPSSVIEPSVLCSVRVINFLAECKLWVHCPSRTILELWNIFRYGI